MKKFRRLLKRCTWTLGVLAAALWLAWLLLPKPELLPPGADFSRVVLDRDGRVLCITLTGDEKYRLPAKFDALSPELLAATLEMEDRRFFSHHGADPRSLLRAAWGAVTRQRLGGGSTLTMQFARLRWGLETRSVRGKVTQLFRAVQLERHHGKTEIAEAYFTFAPYGRNVEGAAAASLLWCGKPARELSLREAAALSVLPQSPTARRPRAGGNPSLAVAQGRLMSRLRAARGEAPSELDSEFSLHPAPLPRFAPHYARRVIASGRVGVPPADSRVPRESSSVEGATQRDAVHHSPSERVATFDGPRETRGPADGTPTLPTVPALRPMDAQRTSDAIRQAVVKTTLDLPQQQTVERSIADFLSRERSRGLRNAAAILVHAPTREMRGYVGSAGFFNDSIEGQVDGVTARRSPGSALKPFIYALAFDAGLIHPRTLLDDAPRRFAGYNPENSDRGFLGPIPAGEALRRSRNVPAVELLARLPGGGLDSFLRDAGVALAKPRGEYGLALALGGAEVSLEELAMLYAGLADDGVARPLCATPGEPGNGGEVANLAYSARWLTLDALRGSDPGAPPGLAWKTGTSHGFRDAWACGVIGEWVLCVWVGNFDGKPMPGLFARETAAPLLFQTVTRLGLREKARQRPAEITDVNLCTSSGDLAGPHCPHCTRGKFIAGVSPIAACTVHREVLLDAVGQRIAFDDGTARREVREFWPAQRLEQFRRAGLPRAEPPPFANGGTANTTGAPPRIVSPQAALTYVLRPGLVAKNAIPLEADASAESRQIHWFAGPRYLGASAPSHPLMWPAAAGKWTIQAVDDSGRVARTRVTVVAAP